MIALGVGASSAFAAEPSIRLTDAAPDQVTPGKWLAAIIAIHNEGDAPMSGELTVRYSLDPGLSVAPSYLETIDAPPANCTPNGQEVECTVDVNGVPPQHLLTYKLWSQVEAGATGTLTGVLEASGGGASNTDSLSFNFDTGPVGPFQFKDLSVEVVDNPTLPPAQAGSHPREVVTAATFYGKAVTPLGGFLEPFLTITSTPEDFRNLTTHLPVGFVGNPTATASRCSTAQLSTVNENPIHPSAQVPACPEDSQVGVGLINGRDVVPIYNVVPPAGVPAEFGIYYQGVTVLIRAKLRPSDNGVDLYTLHAATTDKIVSFVFSFWGNPADSTHDNIRAQCTSGLVGSSGELCPISPLGNEPFIRLPTSCSGPLTWQMEMDTYENPGVEHKRSTTTPAPTGCANVPFEPRASVSPTDSMAHSTSGLDVDISVPQGSGADGIADADVRRVAVALPQGVGLNPAAAEGLEACSDVQLRVGLEGPAECPQASKLGTVEVETPLLEETLDGSVYLLTQNSQDPESGQMYRLAIVLHSNERGVDVKLPGSLVVNKDTGQLTTTFDELPQLPFEAMRLHLKSGPRAPLTTPQTCGTYNTHAVMTSWSGKTVSLDTPFTVNQDCTAPGFAPGFQAGSANPTAGDFSPFTLRVTRDSGMPNLSRISATLPEGELAKLAGVPLCGSAQAATGACPAQSRIGRVVTAVGEGSSPIYLPQPGKAPTAVYLGGPYKGAPYSVVAAVPAQSGPFDLGIVTVRSALRVDPETTQVTVQSDPLPQIFGGIPVTYRDVRVEVDRPQFTLNPTDCEPMAVHGTIGSSAGGSAEVSDRFQVGDCAALGFKPKLAISLKGKPGRTGHPALTAVLTYPKKGDYANIARTSVSLPGSEFLASNHIRTSCTRVQYNAGAGGGTECPKGAIYGRARAFSPLLDKPLEGPVYMRSNGGERELPDLVASLDGQIHVDLVGYVDSNPKTKGLRTTFAQVPDAPVSKFVLKMPAGKKSLLENSTDVCAGKHRAVVKMIAQNGRVANFGPLVRAKCGKRAH
ncbi:MAG TPA: hypothetical protein VG448_12590 [Solirubrobacterales bacterium]|nr:hypothetical protein [Solirubrobacterales bacterium]